jgi:hypothetical protein
MGNIKNFIKFIKNKNHNIQSFLLGRLSKGFYILLVNALWSFLTPRVYLIISVTSNFVSLENIDYSGASIVPGITAVGKATL